MAIGDAVASMMGTAITNRQPSAGVEEQISSIVKPGTTDAIHVYDGTDVLQIINPPSTTRYFATSGSAEVLQPVFNIAIMITNSVYMRKLGTTDKVYVGGVQTNA